MGCRRLIRRAGNLLIESRPVLMATLLAVVIIYMGIAHGERFFNQANLSSVLLDAAQVGILTIGVTILMIGGAIDLSVGSILGLAGIVAGLLVKEYLAPGDRGHPDRDPRGHDVRRGQWPDRPGCTSTP